MIELLIACVAGFGIGFVAGILPGIGVLTMLLTFYTLLADMTLLQLIVVYTVAMGTTQYFGSIPAIIYGVSGEVTSTPAMRYGHPLFLQGNGHRLVAATATGSYIAALFGIAIIYFLSKNVLLFTPFLTNNVRAVMFVTTLAILVAMADSKRISIFMMLAGILAGSIGYNPMFDVRILVPDHTMLDAGLPVNSVFTGLLVLPALVHFRTRAAPAAMDSGLHYPSLKTRFLNLLNLQYLPTITRSAAAGSLMGLIPGASFVISSNVSAAIEKKLFRSDDFTTVVAAESSNNSAVITALIPLLLLALPILPSEAFVLGLAESNGFGVQTSYDFFLANINIILAVLLIVSTLNWAIAGVFYQAAQKIYTVLVPHVYTLLIVFAVLINFYAAYRENQLLFSAICLLIFYKLGRIIKSDDAKSIFLIAYFVSDELMISLYHFYLFHV
jgi:putative tricarboxylic transport membrane protein